MPIVEVTYYQAVCDGCGQNMTEGMNDGISAWEHRETVVDEIRDGDHEYADGVVACWACERTYVEGLSSVEAGHMADREHLAVRQFTDWLKRRAACSEGDNDER